MEETIRIMNITNGDEVCGYWWETREEAEKWISKQDYPEIYEIMEDLNKL